MEVERRFLSLEDQADALGIETRDDGSVRLRGYAAVYDSLSENLGQFRERLLPGAFDRVLSKRKLSVVANFNHSSDHVLGRTENGTLELRSDERGLYFEVQPPDTQFARDLLTQVRRKDIAAASFAFTVDPKDEAYASDERGETIRTIRSVSGLFDVSVVTSGAYKAASVSVRSFEAWKQSTPRKSLLELPAARAAAGLSILRLRTVAR